MQVRFEVFRGTWASWESLFEQAAEFAGRLSPDQVISISHSEDRNEGVVTVWYWARPRPRSAQEATGSMVEEVTAQGSPNADKDIAEALGLKQAEKVGTEAGA
jgi:hypothetical protein